MHPAELWCFAKRTSCFGKCINTSRNIETVLRNILKQLRKAVKGNVDIFTFSQLLLSIFETFFKVALRKIHFPKRACRETHLSQNKSFVSMNGFCTAVVYQGGCSSGVYFTGFYILLCMAKELLSFACYVSGTKSTLMGEELQRMLLPSSFILLSPP